jgi:hypothetical protein
LAQGEGTTGPVTARRRRRTRLAQLQAGLAPEDRLRGLAAEERLRGLSAEELLRGLCAQELERLKRLLH